PGERRLRAGAIPLRGGRRAVRHVLAPARGRDLCLRGRRRARDRLRLRAGECVAVPPAARSEPRDRRELPARLGELHGRRGGGSLRRPVHGGGRADDGLVPARHIQLQHARQGAAGAMALLPLALLITAALTLARFSWVFTGSYLSRLLSRWIRTREPSP